MTRFYSEYEIQKQDKQLNEDLMLSSERFKSELKTAINCENHRSNVDRAKKKACSQYFDYDKFHQMVLGADLKGMKMDDVYVIKPDKAILNPLENGGKFGANEIFKGNFVYDEKDEDVKEKEVLPNDKEISLSTINSEYKLTGKSDPLSFSIYILSLIPNKEKFSEIINTKNMSSDLFTGILTAFGMYLNENFKKEKTNSERIIEFLEILVEAPIFKKLKMFISKKLKGIYEKLSNSEEYKVEIENNKRTKGIIIKILEK